MGQGENLIASSLLDSSPTAILEFFRIYPDTLEKPTTFIPIHGGSNFQKSIFWQGEEYLPLPIECEGFETTSTSRLSRPKIRIANKDLLVSNLLQNNKDFKNAKITRKRTFLKYIDDRNFDGGNPFGTANFNAEISSEDFLVAQKTAENKSFVEIELTSPLDVDNFELNNRRILAKYCYWQYRGCGCNYKGTPVQRENGESFKDPNGNVVVPKPYDNTGFEENPIYIWSKYKSYKKGDLVCMINRKILVRKRPADEQSNKIKEDTFLKSWYVCVQDNTGQNPDSNINYWQVDGCQKTLSACKLRFNDNYYQSWKKFESFKTEPVMVFSPSEEVASQVSYGYDFSIVSSQTQLSWTGAYANAIAKGGRLAVIDEPYKQDIINDLLRAFKPIVRTTPEKSLMWINGNSTGAGNEYKWEGTGKVIRYGFTNYNPGEPNRSYPFVDSVLGAGQTEAYLHVHGPEYGEVMGKWNDLTLNSHPDFLVFNYILEKPSKPKIQKGGGYLSSSNTGLLNILQNSFTLHGWFANSGSVLGAGLINTTDSKSKTVYKNQGYTQNPHAEGGNGYSVYSPPQIYPATWWNSLHSDVRAAQDVLAKEADYNLWNNNKLDFDNFNSFNISIMDKDTLRLKFLTTDYNTISRTANVYDIKYTPQDLNYITLVVDKRRSADHNLFAKSEDFTSNLWAKRNCSIVTTTSGQLMLPSNGQNIASIGTFDMNSDFCDNWIYPSGFSSVKYKNTSWSSEPGVFGIYNDCIAIHGSWGNPSHTIAQHASLTNGFRFSVYVKPINPNSGTHVYIKNITRYAPGYGYYFDRHVAFDLKNVSVKRVFNNANAVGVGSKDNYGCNDPSITEEANGWYRISALIIVDPKQITVSNLAGVEFGIIPSGANLYRTYYTELQYNNFIKQGFADHVNWAAAAGNFYDLLRQTSSDKLFNGSSGQGMLFSGAQLESSINRPGKYFKTNNVAYKHPKFNSDIGDYLALYINGANVKEFNPDRDKNKQLDINVETFKIGHDNSQADFAARKIKGGIASFMLWNGAKDVSGSIFNGYVSSDLNNKKYPINYIDNPVSKDLVAFWDMPDSSTLLPITNNINAYSGFQLSINGDFTTNTLIYNIPVDQQGLRQIEFTALSFGGFPGTNGYSYG